MYKYSHNITKLVKNREGFLVSETMRECTECHTIFSKTSKTVTLCPPCNVKRVQNSCAVTKMFGRANTRAKKSGIGFNIDKSDITIPDVCPILGIPLFMSIGNGAGGKPNSPALDRIDNSKGYIKGNVMVVSHLANMMKSSANPEELLKFAKWVFMTYLER